MDITILYLLIVILIIVAALITLIVYEGRTNRKVTLLINELDELKKELKQIDQTEEKLVSELHGIADNLHRIELSGNHNANFDDTTNSLVQTQTAELNHEQKNTRKSKLNVFSLLRDFNAEHFVGAGLISLMGICLFALGLTYFVKYALEHEWINNVGKVTTGLAGSALLITTAHSLRLNYRAFSSALLGGGLAVQYYTFALAFNEYHFFNENVAFLILLIITTFTIFLSIAYSRQELAGLAVLAGMTAPFIANFNLSNYVILFTFILIIDLGGLILAFFKKWVFVNIITLVFSILFYILWIVNINESGRQIPYIGAFIFITIFYFVFFGMNCIYNVKKRIKFRPIELTSLIFVSVLYYTAGYALMQHINADYKGIFTALIAIFNLIYVIILHRIKDVDRGLVSLVFGLMLVYACLVPPVQLVGKSITLVWSFQTVLLLWISQRIHVILMKLGSAFMTILMLVSLGMDMWDTYIKAAVFTEILTPFLNLTFITNIIAVLALIFNIVRLGKEESDYYIPFIKLKMYRGILGGIALVTLYLTFYLELKYHFIQIINYTPVINLYIGIYNTLFITILTLPVIFKPIKALCMSSWILSVFAFAFFVVFYLMDIITVRNAYIANIGVNFSQFMFHYAIIILLLLTNFTGLYGFIKLGSSNSIIKKAALWLSVLMFIFIVSSELDHILVLSRYDAGFQPAQIVEQAHKLPYTVLWAISSFLLIIIGIWLNIKDIRIISLVLFFVTVLKLFVYDFSSLNESAQIIAFVIMGSILLVVSFLYQKLRTGQTLDRS